jgi:hypothetical protein
VDKSYLPAVVVSFALGFGLAWFLRTPDAGPAAPSVAPVQAQAPAGAAPARFGSSWPMPGQAQAPAPGAAPRLAASVDDLWSQALAPQSGQGYDAEDRLRQLAQGDPAVLRKLVGRYDGARTPRERELLQSILSTVQKPEVVFFANRLAGSSNPEERKVGLEMLRSLAPAAPETRVLVRQALAGEQSPEVLVQALGALQAGAVDPEESAAIVAQLTALSQHADPAVRSQSIARLGQWDKGENASRLAQALSDNAPEVRQAAVFALAQAGVRSPEAKERLMALANNPQETRDVRGSALQVLERFALNKEEYAQFAQARAQVQGR